MALPFRPAQCSERETGGWEDCVWCSGVMLNNAAQGSNDAPSTRHEYEALRVAGRDGPAENPGDGSNHKQLVTGIQNRYHWTPTRVGPPEAPKAPWTVITSRLARPGDCAALQGWMGVWPRTSHWRRWDAQFDEAHDVYVERLDLTPRLWWMNPQAPNSFGGEFIPLAEVKRYYDGFTGGALFARVGQLVVPKTPPWWASNIAPDIQAAYTASKVAGKLKVLGVPKFARYGSSTWGRHSVTYSDLEAGLRKRRINFGTSVQVRDVDALMKPGTGP